MEKTLILLKPCTVQRRLIGEVINRIERKGLRIVGLKMMQLDDAILNEHYADLSMSGQENIIHASDSIETAEIEMKRFFREGEIFEYPDPLHDYFYAPDGD